MIEDSNPRRILVTGTNGYIGQALCRALMEEYGQDDTSWLGVDNFDRQKWVESVGGISLTRQEKKADPRMNFEEIDLKDYKAVEQLYRDFQPTHVVHLASQPSAPYSEKDLQSRIWTQTGNLRMLLNLLCASQEIDCPPDFVVTTTTGIPGAPNGPILEDHMPILAGSAYHVSRGFDSANLALAARQWKLKILEMRTAIVYGTRIDGIDEPVTRLDWDYYFGTVIHRFILSKKMDKEIPIYGKGMQRKPIIALRDVVKSVLNAINQPLQNGHKIVNQVTQCLPVLEMAMTIGGRLKHIDNPRIEKEDHQMVIENQKFLDGYLMNRYTELSEEIPIIENDMETDLLPNDWEKIFNGK